MPEVPGSSLGAMDGSPACFEGGHGFMRDEGSDREDYGKDERADGDNQGESAGFFGPDEVDDADEEDAEDGGSTHPYFSGQFVVRCPRPEDHFLDLQIMHAIHG